MHTMIKCYAFLSMCMGLSYEHLTIFLIALGSLPLDGPAWIWPAPSLRRSCQSTTCTRKTSSSRWRTCSSSTRLAPAPQGTLCSITLLGDTSKDFSYASSTLTFRPHLYGHISFEIFLLHYCGIDKKGSSELGFVIYFLLFFIWIWLIVISVSSSL